jgi:hypothetical protein
MEGLPDQSDLKPPIDRTVVDQNRLVRLVVEDDHAVDRSAGRDMRLIELESNTDRLGRTGTLRMDR